MALGAIIVANVRVNVRNPAAVFDGQTPDGGITDIKVPGVFPVRAIASNERIAGTAI